MNEFEFGWQSLNHTDSPPKCVLKAALFTTYDRADERLLAEHLLPLLLRLEREPDGDKMERPYFLLDLDRRLKQLHDRLVIVSSIARQESTTTTEGENGDYGWIWRSIRHLAVGSLGKAVQHAKLWMLHWASQDLDSVEYLEIVVSSSNLTQAAFRGQIQAAWRACIALNPQRSEARLTGWGLLPEFIQELARSAGGAKQLAIFIDLLARANCPEGVTFVASVPGKHSRETLRRSPWGVAGLRKIIPSGQGTVSVSILAPYVGAWNANSLRTWCAAFDGSPARLELVWIDKHHPWASSWILPQSTLKALTRLGATLLQLPYSDDEKSHTDFHSEHSQKDPRWSHAKVYSLKRGHSRRLLVTSANFSAAAWGSESLDRTLTIENFELGVCVEQATWPFSSLIAFDKIWDAATLFKLPSRGSNHITWVKAAWDGNTVDIECRCVSGHELTGVIQSGNRAFRITKWTDNAKSRSYSAQVKWTDAKRPPVMLRLTCDLQVVSVPIFDERPQLIRENTLPPEVDESAAQTMLDELLFEQYGGRVAAEPDGGEIILSDTPMEDDDGGAVGQLDSYSVPAFAIARQYLRVVDNWADRVKQLTSRESERFERELLRRDGQLLKEAFARRTIRDGKDGSAAATGARLAVEELTIRLTRFPET